LWKGPGDRALRFPGGVRGLRTAGLLLLLGAAITFALHFAEVPDDLYRWLYRHPLSGLDVPDEPSEGSIDAIRYVSLVGGILELVGGVALLAIERIRRPK
jgi:hypothetical protein